MAACDCVGYNGSIGESLPDCPTDSTMTVDACVAGIKSETFSYSDQWSATPTCPIMGSDGMVTRDIKYICYDASSIGQDYLANTKTYCDCNDMDTGWLHEDGPDSPKYTRRKGEFVCGEHTFSTYCEYQMMDPETYEYTTYTQGYSWETFENYFCGPTTLDGIQTTYSCEAGYYLKNGTTCTECPVAADIDGITIYETSDMYNSSNQASSCYVPASSFSIPDDTGTWTWGNDCHYSY